MRKRCTHERTLYLNVLSFFLLSSLKHSSLLRKRRRTNAFLFQVCAIEADVVQRVARVRQEHVLAERDGDVAAADRRRQRPLEDQEEADPEAGSVFQGLVTHM